MLLEVVFIKKNAMAVIAFVCCLGKHCNRVSRSHETLHAQQTSVMLRFLMQRIFIVFMESSIARVSFMRVTSVLVFFCTTDLALILLLQHSKMHLYVIVGFLRDIRSTRRDAGVDMA